MYLKLFTAQAAGFIKRIFFFPFFGEKKIWHNLFEITIFIKGLNGFWEIILGAVLLLIDTRNIHGIIMAVAGYGFATDYFTRQADNFSLQTQYFIAAYFLSYGIVNIFLMVFLLWGKLWAYPAAIAFFTSFIFYLCYRFYIYRSGLLLFFILFDVLFVILTCLEYGRIWKIKNPAQR